MTNIPGQQKNPAIVQKGNGRANSTPAKTNTFAIVSIFLSAIAVAGFAFFGYAMVLAFGVGAGHIALQQIKARGERGARYAYVSLVICYVAALFALVSSIYWSVVTRQQF